MEDRTIYRSVNDTLYPIATVLLDQAGNPIDVGSLTVQFSMVTHPAGTLEVDWTATGVTKQPTQTFTTSASTDKATCVAHSLRANDQIIVSTTTTLPAGLSASTRDFVRDGKPNSFKFSLEPNGAVVDITSAGSGTHRLYLVGHVQYDFTAGNVDTDGMYRCAFRINTSSEYGTFPGDSTTLLLSLVSKP